MMRPDEDATARGRNTRDATVARVPRRVVLVDNFFYTTEKGIVRVEVSPHLGLMSLASVLESARHRVEIVDPKCLFASTGFAEPGPAFIEFWASEICLKSPDVVGFTAYGISFPFVVAAAEAIRRRRPHLPIILGGPHATILAEEILAAFSCFDAVAHYECEGRIVGIVEGMCGDGDLEGIEGLSRRSGKTIETTALTGGLINMDEVPRPALHLYPITGALKELPLEAGRGCPYECSFCSTASFFQRRYRVKSNRALVGDMDWAFSAYGISRFNLNHDLFGLKRSTLLEFCDLVERRGYTWCCSMRPDQVDAALGERMAGAGCRNVYFGFETGSQRLQTAILKKLDLDAAFAGFADFLGSDIAATVSFITGFPEEDEEDQTATLDMIGRLLALDPARVMPQLHVLAPEPGTALAGDYEGISLDGYGPENCGVPFPDLVAKHPLIFSAFHHFHSKLPRRRIRQASLFVQNLLPELGYLLAVHLNKAFFGDRLSAMFEACLVENAPRREALGEASEAIVSSMWTALSEFLRREASPYHREIVHFARMSALVRRLKDGLPRNGREAAFELGAKLSADGWLVGTFAIDVTALAAHLAARPDTLRVEPFPDGGWRQFACRYVEGHGVEWTALTRGSQHAFMDGCRKVN